MKLLSDLDVSGKKVFLRADLDVPVSGEVIENTDDLPRDVGGEAAIRLKNLRPTVDFLLSHGAVKVILAGHIDRPDGPDPVLSTKKLKLILESILDRSVIFNPKLENTIENLELLENLRFFQGEVKNDMEFAKQLAGLADVYVNEAFGNCHREHASMVLVPQLVSHAAGLHLQKEVEVLSGILSGPERPLVAVVGGVKIETKVPLIENLAKTADFVLVGGILPKEIARQKLKFSDKIIVAELDDTGKDISEKSIERFEQVIAGAKTVVWNGPMGFFEQRHEAGTVRVAQAIAESGAFSVVGGGETTDFLERASMLEGFSFVSSGGGAMLEFLSGKQLPGLAALE